MKQALRPSLRMRAAAVSLRRRPKIARGTIEAIGLLINSCQLLFF